MTVFGRKANTSFLSLIIAAAFNVVFQLTRCFFKKNQ